MTSSTPSDVGVPVSVPALADPSAKAGPRGQHVIEILRTEIISGRR